MNSPLVSIITPTWNRRELLKQCVASVQAQTFTNWEHVVVDDGSDDGTEEILQALAAENSRVRYCKREGDKRGANVCRNQGLRKSRGEFVIFLDSDDLLAPDCLENRVVLMQRNRDLDFTVYQTGLFMEKVGDRHQQAPAERFGDDLLRFLTFDLPWIITAPIWRRESLERLGGFDEALPSWQDVDLHLRAVCAGMHYLKVPRIDHHVRWQYEETKVSVRQRRCPSHLRAAGEIFAKFERLVREGPGMDWCRQRAFCCLYFLLAEHWVEAGHVRAALKSWREARARRLAPALLHRQGAILLWALSFPPVKRVVARLIHKWKGWVRFRLIPELLLDHSRR
jgi:glycosyltransferase involved in cell wall biosynthesis